MCTSYKINLMQKKLMLPSRLFFEKSYAETKNDYDISTLNSDYLWWCTLWRVPWNNRYKGIDNFKKWHFTKKIQALCFHSNHVSTNLPLIHGAHLYWILNATAFTLLFFLILDNISFEYRDLAIITRSDMEYIVSKLSPLHLSPPNGQCPI